MLRWPTVKPCDVDLTLNWLRKATSSTTSSRGSKKKLYDYYDESDKPLTIIMFGLRLAAGWVGRRYPDNNIFEGGASVEPSV